MNIVNSGSEYMVYGEEVKTYKSLPSDTYRVCFSQQKGFFLRIHNDLTVGEKIYGPYVKKVEKVMNTFETFDRNMGVILSGRKGTGKSVFGRLLAEEGKKRGLPLVIVDRCIPGIDAFISSIKQQCIVLFDEFEKTFIDEEGQQEGLLSLFDGIDDGKKLFVITCNATYKLNEFLINRPGRFHYHFVLNSPSYKDAEEYLNDSLEGEAKKYISDILMYHTNNAFTYDILRAIVTELNNGYALKETLQDLNIEMRESLYVHPVVTFDNGIIAELTSPPTMCVDITRPRHSIWLKIKRSSLPEWISDEIAVHICSAQIDFRSESIICDTNGYSIAPESVTAEINPEWDEIHNLNPDDETKRKLASLVNEAHVISIDLQVQRPTDTFDVRKFVC